MSSSAPLLSDDVILDDPSNLAGSYASALVADVKQALDAWLTHLGGLGTLTVQVNLMDDGQNGLLADGAPTLDAVVGTEDGRTLIESGAVYELSNGTHLGGGSSDITIDVNAAYLGQEYLGTGADVPAGQYDGLSLFEHEIAHGLGFGGETSPTGSLDATYETGWDHDLASVGGTEVFTGANATAANGGVLVNVTTLDNGEGYAHLANSAADPNAQDLMTGLGLPTGVRRPISAVDLGILADIGVPVTGMAGTLTVGGPARATVVAGAASSIGGLTLSDTGAFTSSTLSLTVTDTAGQLSATRVGAASVAAASNGRTLVLAGSLADVGTELASLVDTVSAGGTDTVQLAAVDSFGNVGVGVVLVSAGSAAAAPASIAVAVPRVLSLAAMPGAAGPLDAGRSIGFVLATSGAVTVGTAGSLGLTLSDGGIAAFDAAASTPTSLAFTTTVAAGQNAANLTVTGLTLSGGATITDSVGAAASLVVTAATAGAATGLVVDTLTPGIPTLALATASDTGVIGDGITGAAVQTLTGSAEAGSLLTLTDGGALLGTVTASASGRWSYTAGLAPGSHDLGATATDAAGNVSAQAVLALVVDTVAPGAPTLVLDAAGDSGASDADGLTDVAHPTLSGVAAAGSRVVVADVTAAGTAILGSAVASGGTWSLVAPALAQGVNTLVATASDAAGNTSSATTLAVTLDTVAPGAPTLGLAAGGVAGGDPAFSGTAEAGSVVTLLDGSDVVGAGTAASNGAWGVTLAAPLALGAAVLTATATDAAGNVSAASRPLVVVHDAASSGTVSVSSAPALGLSGATGTQTLVTLQGTADQAEGYAATPGTSFVVVDGGLASIAASADPAGALTVFGTAGTISLANGGGSGVVVAGGATALLLGGGLSASSLVAFTGQAATRYVGGAGADEIIGGDGSLDLAGGSGGSLLVFGGAGSLVLAGGAETDTVVGGAGSETIHAGVGAVFAGTGGSRLFADGAGTFLAGNVSGDQLQASSAGGDILAAGTGNETLAGAGAASADLVFGGAGEDSISLGLGADTFAGGAGGGTVQLGAGNATLYLGTGAASVIAVASGGAGGTDTVSGFRVGTDHLRASGYAGAATLTSSGHSTTVGLADGTRIVLSDVSATTTAALLG